MRLTTFQFMALCLGVSAASLKDVGTTLESRSDEIDGDMTCEGFDLAEKEHKYGLFTEGIDYLKELTDDDKICGAPAGECSRVSCSWGAAVYLCNDSEEDQNNVECAAIGRSVERLRDDCNNGRRQRKRKKALGWQAGPNGLSVHIGKNEC